MLRRFLPLLIILVVLTALVMQTPAAQAGSSGCNAIGGLGGVLPELPGSKSTGPVSFMAGDKIYITAVQAGTVTPYSNIDYFFTSPDGSTSKTSGSSFTYTIPNDGTYTLTMNNTFGVDAQISASCGAPGGQWPGYSDGRLSPVPDEYYSIWCGNGEVTVYRTVNGSGQLLARVEITQMAGLAVGKSLFVKDNAGNTLQVGRLSSNQFAFSGSDGNKAGTGNKVISVTDCKPPVNLEASPTASLNTIQITYGVLTATPTKSIDSDGDGVPDAEDFCPHFKVTAPTRRAHGCRDWDGDGFVNPDDFNGNPVVDQSNPVAVSFIDQCPNEAGGEDTFGCPAQPATVVNTTVTAQLPPDVPMNGSGSSFDSGVINGVWDRVTAAGDWGTIAYLAGWADACTFNVVGYQQNYTTNNPVCWSFTQQHHTPTLTPTLKK